jgi:Zn finger protein HypA/HybF involved in hydrogenase expression
VNDRFNKVLQYNTSGLGCWLSLILIAFILASVGLGWVVNGLVILFALLLISPIITFWGLQWWLKRKLIQAQCPVCNYEFTGFKNTEFNCPSCGETLKVEADHFTRMTPPGTIDVDAVEVSTQTLEEGN